jgi:pimeloyl-ACP methyl ester carboxylesterase
MWEDPALSRFLERLATMGRVICFDKRGTGISDPVPLGAIPTIERWMDDITTVIDEVGCKRVVVFGHGDGGPIAMLFAATYPERTEALVLGDTFARMRHAADYPEGLSEVDADRKGTQLYETGGVRIDRCVRAIPRAGAPSSIRRFAPGARASSGSR